MFNSESLAGSILRCSRCGYPDGQHSPDCISARKPEKDTVKIEMRGFDDYEQLSGLKFDDYKDGLTLDIGSGGHQNFEKEAKKKKIKVIDFSSDFSNPAHRKTLKESNASPRWKVWDKPKISTVAARAQEMPFEDNSFECEVGIYSFTNYYHFPEDEEHYNLVLNETIRTLKPNGTAVFYPLWYDDYNDPSFQRLISVLSDKARFTIEPLPNEAQNIEHGTKEFNEVHSIGPNDPGYASKLEEWLKDYKSRRLAIRKY